MPRLRCACALWVISSILSSCSPSGRSVQTVSTAPPAAAPTPAAPAWAAFRDDFIEGLFRQDPYFAVYQGRHDYDGRLPDWSDAGLKAKRIS